MRVLLTWELGLNLGHLTRLLPVAQQLKTDGNVVLVAVRDIQAAATVLGPAGISFVQASHLPQGIPLAHRVTGYADILLSQGWSDRSALWGLTQGWVGLFQLFLPDKLILDYSPTASLAARIAKIPTTLIGNGFELPPLTDPMPVFPGFLWASPEKAAQSENIAASTANSVLKAYKQPPISALRDLMTDQIRLFATFPEFDHYGKRNDAQYIGLLLGHLNASPLNWPEGEGPKFFACLRPDTSHVKEILTALTTMPARVVCVASGFNTQQLAAFRKTRIRYSLAPVDLEPLLDANFCITYGAEGTIMRFLLAGVPQLISPWHVEIFMAARIIEANHLGCELTSISSQTKMNALKERGSGDPRLKANTSNFVLRHAGTRRRHSVDRVLSTLYGRINTNKTEPSSSRVISDSNRLEMV